MPLRRAAAAAKHMIEQGQQEQLSQGLPADRLTNQLPSRAVPPASGSARGGVLLSDTNPAANGSAAPGTSSAASRGDHVHASAGGGGTITVEEVDGSPTSSTVTTLKFPNGSLGIASNVATYTPVGGGSNPYTDPTLQTFAWVNQGGASEVVSGATISLIAPQASGYQNRIRKKAAPATPYVVTAAIQPLYNPYASGNGYGLLFREGSSGKLSGIYVELSGGPIPTFYATKWTDHATYSATYGSSTPLYVLPLWLRIADTGTNRSMAWSCDGTNFLTVHSVGRTDFLTADEVGWTVNANNASYGMTAMLLSWSET